jgi:hypothetical protein
MSTVHRRLPASGMNVLLLLTMLQLLAVIRVASGLARKPVYR